MTNVYQIGDPYQDTDTKWDDAGNTCYFLRTENAPVKYFVVCKHTQRFYSLYDADPDGTPVELAGQGTNIRVLLQNSDLRLIATPGQDTPR